MIFEGNKKIKLSTLLKFYEEHGKLNKKSCSWKSYVKGIGLFFGKDTYAQDISVDRIEKFKKWLKEEKNIGNSTINKYLFALSKMYRLGIENKLLKENPVHFVVKFKEKNYKIRYLTKEEEKRLYEAIDSSYPYLRPLVTTALQTGMRRGEIFNLKWSNIDFEYGFIELLETKSGKSRKIPISDKLMEIFKNLRVNAESEYIFINPYTKAPYTDIKRSFHTVLRQAGIENFRFHDLRHTVATRLVEKGIDLVVVKEILGHSKIETTMRYAHAVPERKLQAINVLNNYFTN